MYVSNLHREPSHEPADQRESLGKNRPWSCEESLPVLTALWTLLTPGWEHLQARGDEEDPKVLLGQEKKSSSLYSGRFEDSNIYLGSSALP